MNNLENNENTANTIKKEFNPPKISFVISLTAGILVVIEGLIRLVQGRAIEISGISDQIPRRILVGIIELHVGFIALFFGALIIVGAILLFRTKMTLAGALIVLVFSILSIITGGLFGFLGFVIGIVGGILGLLKK